MLLVYDGSEEAVACSCNVAEGRLEACIVSAVATRDAFERAVVAGEARLVLVATVRRTVRTKACLLVSAMATRGVRAC
jgi:hypothetical protein